jgi:hypothetical protein
MINVDSEFGLGVFFAVYCARLVRVRRSGVSAQHAEQPRDSQLTAEWPSIAVLLTPSGSPTNRTSESASPGKQQSSCVTQKLRPPERK